MDWIDSEDFQKLVAAYPKLEDPQHRDAFVAYVENMWSRPKTYADFLRAYLEFETPAKPTFRRLRDTSRSRKKKRRRGRRKSRRSRR